MKLTAKAVALAIIFAMIALVVVGCAVKNGGELCVVTNKEYTPGHKEVNVNWVDGRPDFNHITHMPIWRIVIEGVQGKSEVAETTVLVDECMYNSVAIGDQIIFKDGMISKVEVEL